MLEIDDIVAIDVVAFVGVVVFANGVRSLARSAARKSWVTSCFALSFNIRDLIVSLVRLSWLTCLQRVHAVKVWATCGPDEADASPWVPSLLMLCCLGRPFAFAGLIYGADW